MSRRGQPVQSLCRPSLPPPSLCRTFHRRRHCRRRISVAPSIAVAVASPSHLPSPSPLRRRRIVHRIHQKCLAAGGHYDGIVCSLPLRHPPTAQEEKAGVPPRYGYAPEVLAPTLLLYLNLSHDGVAVPTAPPTSSLASSLSSPAVTTTSSFSSSVVVVVASVLLLFVM